MPPSLVQTTNERGTEVYFEVGLVTASELLKLSKGVAASAVKMKTTAERNEHGEKQDLYLISLAGMGAGDVAAMRKIKVFDRVHLSHGQLLLQPCNQIRLEQGEVVFDHNFAREVAQKTDGLKPAGRLRLPTLASIQEKADMVIANRRLAEAALAGDKSLEGVEVRSEETGSESDGDENDQKAKAGAPKRALGIMVASRLQSEGKKGGKDKKKSAPKKNARERSPSPSSVHSKSRLFQDSEGKYQLDEEMRKVAAKCKTTVSSLGNLNVHRILLGEKLGVSISSVGVNAKCVFVFLFVCVSVSLMVSHLITRPLMA